MLAGLTRALVGIDCATESSRELTMFSCLPIAFSHSRVVLNIDLLQSKYRFFDLYKANRTLMQCPIQLILLNFLSNFVPYQFQGTTWCYVR